MIIAQKFSPNYLYLLLSQSNGKFLLNIIPFDDMAGDSKRVTGTDKYIIKTIEQHDCQLPGEGVHWADFRATCISKINKE